MILFEQHQFFWSTFADIHARCSMELFSWKLSSLFLTFIWKTKGVKFLRTIWKPGNFGCLHTYQISIHTWKNPIIKIMYMYATIDKINKLGRICSSSHRYVGIYFMMNIVFKINVVTRWCRPVMPLPMTWEAEEDHKFEASGSNLVRPFQNRN